MGKASRDKSKEMLREEEWREFREWWKSQYPLSEPGDNGAVHIAIKLFLRFRDEAMNNA